MNSLKKDALYKELSHISDYCRGIVLEVPKEDSYPLQYALRSNSSDACYCLAEAIGSTDPRDAYWKYGATKRALFGLSDVIRQVHKLGYIQLEPETMLRLEKAVAEIEGRIESSKAGFADYFRLLDSDTYKVKEKI